MTFVPTIQEQITSWFTNMTFEQQRFIMIKHRSPIKDYLHKSPHSLIDNEIRELWYLEQLNPTKFA